MGSGAAMAGAEKYDARLVPSPKLLFAAVCCAAGLAACGSEGVSVSGDDPTRAGADIFATKCGGCHTLTPAGTQGSGNRALRAQGPNFDQRPETYDEVLFAIRNGGFSGAIMPQNIVVGEEADQVAKFLSEYAGGDIESQARPTPDAGDEIETGDDTVQPGTVQQPNDEEGPGEASAGASDGEGERAGRGGGDSGGGDSAAN